MKLHLAQNAELPVFTSHGPGYVAINGTHYEGSVLICGQQIEVGWAPEGFDGLTAEQLARLAGLEANIVLFGSGERQRFLPPALLKPLIERGIGLEIMDTLAACRTYNILVAEGRQVACGLIIEPVLPHQNQL